MYVTAMPNQVRRPATDVMLANQLNTLPEPEWTPMYANEANVEEAMSAVTGNPFRRVFLNMEGAFPAIARPSVCIQCAMLGNDVRRLYALLEVGDSHRARELVYRSLDAADQAEVRRQALMSCRERRLSTNSGGCMR
jgi:hypothetical protein